MTAKEYLSRYKGLDMLINAKVQELSKIRKQNDAEKIMKAECAINADIDQLISGKSEIVDTIKFVENPFYQAILYNKYINGKTIEKIAEETCYSVRNINRLHKLALGELEKYIKK